MTENRLLAGVCLFTFIMLIHTNAWSQSNINASSSAELLSAIEDYRFSDLDTAISKLLKLKKTSPNNLRLLKYLGLSYQEAGRSRKAKDIYLEWLSKTPEKFGLNAKFAHIGIAKIHMKNNDYSEAAEQLKRWLSFHPKDLTSQSLYGNILIQANKLDVAKGVWRGLTINPLSSNEQKASGYYYLAWIAYQKGDLVTTKEQSKRCLETEPAGAYAAAAKKLMSMKPRSKFSASVSIEEYYTDNIELIPDYVPSSGQANEDFITQTGANFSYSFPSILLTYAYNGTLHADRSDFDLDVHSLSAKWQKDSWSVMPHYEYVELSKTALYNAMSLDINWGYQDWSIGYSATTKQFNDNFSASDSAPASDLTRLGGVTHAVTLIKTGKIDNIKHSFSFGLTDESTKGDATHNKTDNFKQASIAGSLSKNIKTFGFGASANAYLRAYENGSALANGLTRQDRYIQLATFASWKPWQDYQPVVLNAAWQNNTSNYNQSNVPLTEVKEYSAFRVGVAWSYQW